MSDYFQINLKSRRKVHKDNYRYICILPELDKYHFEKRCVVFPFDIISVWTPDQRLLMVADTRWRADTRGSSSSVEASVSSLTNGTHSSLNTEMEEDELAYSIEPNVQCNTYMHFNGYTCGKIKHGGLVSP